LPSLSVFAIFTIYHALLSLPIFAILFFAILYHPFFTIITTIIMLFNMGVSKNSDTPKWMVYNGNPYRNG